MKTLGLLLVAKTFWSFYRWVVDKSRMTYKPAELHVEVVPFFYGRHSNSYYNGLTLFIKLIYILVVLLKINTNCIIIQFTICMCIL